METKHTPGPWKMAEIEDDTKNLTHMIVAEYNETLLITYALPPTDIVDEFYANAKLIAAAPELLEACQDALDYFKVVFGEDTHSVLTDTLRNAISKAGAE